MTDPMYQKWFVKFRAGEFLRDDAPRPGRPVEVNSDQIKTLTESNQLHIPRKIAKNMQIDSYR